MLIYFSDFFKVKRKTLNKYGAFDVSLIADLPLFIDPFLLFNSDKPKYKQLHDEMIDYISFLRDKATTIPLDRGAIDAWYRFTEVKQNWLCYTLSGNQ